MLAFARRFDPQPFHVDERAAAASLFGGLAASGWFTAGLWMRAYVDGILARADGLGSPGGEHIAWPAPVFAGDQLRAGWRCWARGARAASRSWAWSPCARPCTGSTGTRPTRARPPSWSSPRRSPASSAPPRTRRLTPRSPRPPRVTPRGRPVGPSRTPVGGGAPVLPGARVRAGVRGRGWRRGQPTSVRPTSRPARGAESRASAIATWAADPADTVTAATGEPSHPPRRRPPRPTPPGAAAGPGRPGQPGALVTTAAGSTSSCVAIPGQDHRLGARRPTLGLSAPIRRSRRTRGVGAGPAVRRRVGEMRAAGL